MSTTILRVGHDVFGITTGRRPPGDKYVCAEAGMAFHTAVVCARFPYVATAAETVTT